MPEPKKQLPSISSRLLAEAEALQQLEREKREVPISTPEFHRLADEVQHRARQVFSLAAEEESVGDQAPTDGDAINDVASDQLTERGSDSPLASQDAEQTNRR